MASTKRPKVEELVFVGTNVPAGLRDRLKAIAVANDRSMSKELRRAVQAHVDAHENAGELRDGESNGGAA